MSRIISILTIMVMVAGLFLTAPAEASAAGSPAKVKVSSVKASGSSIVTKWKKVSGAKGYQVVIAEKNGSSYTTVYKKTTKKLKLKSAALSDGTYRVRVRAYKKSSSGKVYGSYSKAKTVKIDTGDTIDTGSIKVTTGSGEATSATEDGVTTWSITKDGTYTLSGSGTNTLVEVADGLTVTLKLSDCTIDDSTLSAKSPLISAGKNSTVSITLSGDSVFKGAAKAAKGIIYQNGSSAALSFSGSGSLTLSDTAGADGIRSKGTVTITDGSFDIDVYGDGIQAETIDISGGDLDIATYFENAGLNYYNTALANTDLGTYNTMSTDETSYSKTKTERINIDTGSHKGIKAGSKAESYSYKSVEDGSEYTAGTEYSSSASGGLTISGGTIKVDTTATGIKYNNGSGGMQSGSSGSGNLTAADDGKVIIGAPEDGIKSNNDCTISGGTIEVASPDDGISVAGILNVTGSAGIKVTTAYEGIEASTIKVGTGSDSPSISVYTNDDGINAAGKDSITYVYDDEDEESYTKTTVSYMTDHDMTVNSGTVTVTIADDKTQSYSLQVANGYGVVSGSTYSGTYSANGDGIDCNGSFYAKGGTTVIWGANSSDNSPVDVADNSGAYEIASGATVLAAGSSGMVSNPTSLGQPAVVYSASVSAGSISIKDSSGNTIATATAPKSFSYMLFSSPDLTSGSSYTLCLGSSSMASATASTSISGGGQGGPGGGDFPGGSDGPGGNPPA